MQVVDHMDEQTNNNSRGELKNRVALWSRLGIMIENPKSSFFIFHISSETNESPKNKCIFNIYQLQKENTS